MYGNYENEGIEQQTDIKTGIRRNWIQSYRTEYIIAQPLGEMLDGEFIHVIGHMLGSPLGESQRGRIK